jgi:hypothetical protein
MHSAEVEAMASNSQKMVADEVASGWIKGQTGPEKEERRVASKARLAVVKQSTPSGMHKKNRRQKV